MVQINFKDLGSGNTRVYIKDMETGEMYTMDKDYWDEIKREMKIDENSGNIMESINQFEKTRYEQSVDMYIPNLMRR